MNTCFDAYGITGTEIIRFIIPSKIGGASG